MCFFLIQKHQMACSQLVSQSQETLFLLFLKLQDSTMLPCVSLLFIIYFKAILSLRPSQLIIWEYFILLRNWLSLYFINYLRIFSSCFRFDCLFQMKLVQDQGLLELEELLEKQFLDLTILPMFFWCWGGTSGCFELELYGCIFRYFISILLYSSQFISTLLLKFIIQYISAIPKQAQNKPNYKSPLLYFLPNIYQVSLMKNKLFFVLKTSYLKYSSLFSSIIINNINMNIIASRLPAIKFIALAGIIQLGLTYSSNISGPPMLTIGDYIEGDVKPRAPFIITGVLKPRSIKIGKGLQKRFKITDNTYDITCIFKGTSKTQFNEGELLVMESYCPDIANKETIIITNYLTKHSMESTEWQKKRAVDNQSFGLEGSFK